MWSRFGINPLESVEYCYRYKRNSEVRTRVPFFTSSKALLIFPSVSFQILFSWIFCLRYRERSQKYLFSKKSFMLIPVLCILDWDCPLFFCVGVLPNSTVKCQSVIITTATVPVFRKHLKNRNKIICPPPSFVPLRKRWRFSWNKSPLSKKRTNLPMSVWSIYLGSLGGNVVQTPKN